MASKTPPVPPARPAPSGARLFVFGLGYSGQQIAAAVQAAGWQVGGTTRDPARAAALRARGIAAEIWPRPDQPGAPPEGLALASHVISAAPPAAGQDDPVLAQLSAADLSGKAGAIYLSSTSVYGDRGGAWVDESATCTPVSDQGRARLRAEAAWSALGCPVTVLRLAAIYGPGRSAFDRLRAGRARRIVKPGQVFSRVHVADLVRATLALLARPDAAGLLNLCDDEPAPPQDVIAHAAALLNIPAPPEEDFASADLGRMTRFFYSDSKRVSNARAHQTLPGWLSLPDYRAGLAAILAEECAGA